MKRNEYYDSLPESYLFTDIARRVTSYQAAHPEKKILRMGIGDVTRPLAPAVAEAMEKAAAEMGESSTFRGYGPEQGYDFLRNRIAKHYESFGVFLDMDEIFISDGAKSDLGNITDLFDRDNLVLIPDPVYPVYVDTNRMNGRTIRFLDASAENDFLPMPPQEHGDIVYLCSPNNPTGAAYTRDALQKWVDWANAEDAVLLFDAAYEVFIQGNNIPHSIFELPGAKRCAIEFCSLSKTAGFTGTRCGYTVVPKALCEGKLNHMWNRRQTTKFNGVSYIVQRGAEAVFTKEAWPAILENVAYYQENARVMGEALRSMGIPYWGGVHSPYLWMRCPGQMDSWRFFDRLLKEAAVVGTPGVGFGKNGEGYFRLTAFGTHENTAEAMERMRALRF